jgi:hypothetical protein
LDGLPKGLQEYKYKLRLSLPLLVTGYVDTTTHHHVHHTVGHHHIFCCYFHCFSLLCSDFSLNKKTPAVVQRFDGYILTLKLCHKRPLRSFPHHATHIANH